MWGTVFLSCVFNRRSSFRPCVNGSCCKRIPFPHSVITRSSVQWQDPSLGKVGNRCDDKCSDRHLRVVLPNEKPRGKEGSVSKDFLLFEGQSLHPRRTREGKLFPTLLELSLGVARLQCPHCYDTRETTRNAIRGTTLACKQVRKEDVQKVMREEMGAT